MNAAILLSGGTGSRITSDCPKQYISVEGRMIVIYALCGLYGCDRIDGIWIVADVKWREAIERDAAGWGIAFAGSDPTHSDRAYTGQAHTGSATGAVVCGFSAPGRSRQESVLYALCDIERAGGADTVLIHDAARPCVTTELLDRCYDALRDCDGVMPSLPMKDTVYDSADGESISGLLDRGRVFAGQAPELFCFDKYIAACRALSADELLLVNGASEPAVKAGMNIKMIPGDERNYKITTTGDLERFRQQAGRDRGEL